MVGFLTAVSLASRVQAPLRRSAVLGTRLAPAPAFRPLRAAAPRFITSTRAAQGVEKDVLVAGNGPKPQKNQKVSESGV